VPWWKYRGVGVRVPATADIPHRYKPQGRDGYIVQEILDGTEPWNRGQDPIETIVDLDQPVRAIIVPIKGRRVVWATHAYHYAKRVQVSPFVRTLPVMTNSFTVVMAGTPTEPMVVRAFPGEYAPPLPWQRHRDPTEDLESLNFWRRHAYVYSSRLVVHGSITSDVPAWFV
jgi:hypothetical protein